MNIKYRLKEAIRKLGVRYLHYKVGWLSSLTYPPHDDGKCPCGACIHVKKISTVQGRPVAWWASSPRPRRSVQCDTQLDTPYPGHWLWNGLKVHYCPECAAHLSDCGVVQLMVHMDNQDPVSGTVADLDNGQEALQIKRELKQLGCKPYWGDDAIDEPSYGIPFFKDDDMLECYPIRDTETWLNYLRRIYRFAKKVAPKEAHHD